MTSWEDGIDFDDVPEAEDGFTLEVILEGVGLAEIIKEFSNLRSAVLDIYKRIGRPASPHEVAITLSEVVERHDPVNAPWIYHLIEPAVFSLEDSGELERIIDYEAWADTGLNLLVDDGPHYSVVNFEDVEDEDREVWYG